MNVLRNVTIFVLLTCVPSFAQAGTFFEETFDTGTLMSQTWNTSSCVFMGLGEPADGCNPIRSTALPFSGTHSLKHDFTGTAPGSNGCDFGGPPNVGFCGVWITRSYTASQDKWFRVWSRYANFFHGSNPTNKRFYDYVADETVSFVWEHVWSSDDLSITGQGIPSQVCPSGNTGSTCHFPPPPPILPLVQLLTINGFVMKVILI